MSDVTDLGTRLGRLADEMTAIAEAMHAAAIRNDGTGEFHQAFLMHSHANELSNAARVARGWSRELKVPTAAVSPADGADIDALDRSA